MKYERNQYSEGVSICSLIIAGILIYWGLNDILIKPVYLGGNFNWFGIVWLGIAAAIIVGQVAAFMNRSRLRNAVKYEFEEHPNATIEEISSSTGISLRDVKAIILDLKATGEFRGHFSSKTGELKGVPTEEQDLSRYCQNCGAKLSKESAQYCTHCGAKI